MGPGSCQARPWHARRTTDASCLAWRALYGGHEDWGTALSTRSGLQEAATLLHAVFSGIGGEALRPRSAIRVEMSDS
jgi:hypothetical protein